MKKSLTPWRPAVLLALAALVAAGPALADKDDAPGQQRKREAAPATQATAAPSGSSGSQVSIRVGAVFGDQDRATVQAYYGDRYAQAKRCPPGLAKKNNGCLPPGQAKKLVVGQPLPPDTVWYSVPAPVIARLPVVGPGYRYVRVGADIVLLGGKPNVVIDVMASLPL